MGFESFRIELNDGSATAAELIDTVMSWEHVLEDDSSFMPSSHCFLLRDAQHTIEIEVMDSPLTVSCRFTLCHPPSVDSALFELAKRFLSQFGMRVRICDDVIPEHAHEFSLEHFDEFARATVLYIAARRREWKAAFGNREMAATTNEVHEQFILPLCQTPIEKAG